MPDPKITTNGKDPLPPTTRLLSHAFAHDPLITYLLHTMPSTTQRQAYLPAYFSALLKAAALNGGVFDEVGERIRGRGGDGEGNGEGEGEWASCGVLMPPGKRVDNFWTLVPAGFLGVLWGIGVGGCRRMLGEFTPKSDAAKAKGLKGRKDYFYVFFLGTHSDARGKGLCSALVREYQARAAKVGVPLWLEATTAYSMRLYERLGFEIVDKMVFGKGKVGADGLECKGGEGVPIWGMIWEPPEVKAAAS